MRITQVASFNSTENLNSYIRERRHDDGSFKVIEIKPFLQQSNATQKYLVRKFLLIFSYDTRQDKE
jgi:hypothetical protein